MVPLSVVADHGVPPELVDGEGAEDRVRVVHLVVVAHPSADQAPHGLPSGIGAQARDLLGLATY